LDDGGDSLTSDENGAENALAGGDRRMISDDNNIVNVRVRDDGWLMLSGYIDLGAMAR
jgi:hypothetical protein